MGIALYSEPILFLRELLQNAVDTCRHRRALYAKQPDLGAYSPSVEVKIVKNEYGEILQVLDNGMGMDAAIIRTFFAKVGRSYYKSGQFLEDRTKLDLDFHPVSQFGIGVLSVFMAGHP